MNIFPGNWHKLKQELVPVICLSLMQIWWSFNFPAFIRLGAPWSTIVALSSSILGILVIVFTFSYANNYSNYVTLKHLDEVTREIPLKNISRSIYISLPLIVIFIVWRKNYFNMPASFYFILYTFFILGFLLFYRAAYRLPDEAV